MNDWSRVTRQHPCLICGKPDWCTRGLKGFCCMRLESTHPLTNGGWLHSFQTHPTQTSTPPRHTTKNNSRIPPSVWSEQLALWKNHSTGQLSTLAAKLGLPTQSLQDLDCSYAQEHRAFAFPMRNARTDITGIRLRSPNGHKWAVTGSRQGLFIPLKALSRLAIDIVLVCEGPTDTAAALTLGFFSIGRPSCLGCEEAVAHVLREIGPKEVVLVHDNDEAGTRGAAHLSKSLPRCRSFVPPTKDLRAFLISGGTRELMLSMLSDQLPL